MTSAPTDLLRRRFLQASTGVATAAGATGTAAAQQTHTVDMTDNLVFDPDSLTIAPGDTVVWENVGSIGHSVTAYEEDIPNDATYFASGGFDDEQSARSAYSAGDPDSGDVAGGESFEHTFEVEGSYEYFCIPHESAGMVASLEVREGGAPENGEFVPAIPDEARTLAVGVTGVLFAVIALAYLFLKYGEE